MAVLVFAENNNGKFKKPVFEAASYGKELADKLGVALHAVVLGHVDSESISQLGKYGVSAVHTLSDARLNSFNDQVFAKAIAHAGQAIGAKAVVMAQTYDGKAVAPRVAVRLKASMVSGAIENPTVEGTSLVFKRLVNSGKGIETVRTNRSVAVITVKVNSYGLKESSAAASAVNLDFSFGDADLGAKSVEVVKTTNKISITDAETVISGGRGFKGPENWGPLEELADLLGAGTACSKPVSDMDWRPHHEHVGQTGIQIAPNLYIAIGISGAIQHLAGINSSKNIVVINKDPEAPFFKIADYGIVGDLFEVLPKINTAVRAKKAANA
jgi:electron transfer flavoprotein alpha subunit